MPTHGVQTGNATGYAMGLTKRELFAAMAMQTKYAECETDPAKAAQWALQLADALLAELAKEPT